MTGEQRGKQGGLSNGGSGLRLSTRLATATAAASVSPPVPGMASEGSYLSVAGSLWPGRAFSTLWVLSLPLTFLWWAREAKPKHVCFCFPHSTDEPKKKKK